MKRTLGTTALGLACGMALLAPTAQAVEFAGMDFYGYLRGGYYESASSVPKGGYSLGGDAQKFRLGNEGDQGLEFGIGKSFTTDNGHKWGVRYMATVWDGNRGTAEAYATASGFDFAPGAEFWAGQRRLRLQDVHIVDRFFADYGDNYGAGFTGWKLGPVKLGVSLFSSGSVDDDKGRANNARRLNVDVSGIPTNPGGSLRVTGTLVKGDFLYGRDGVGLSLVHNQEDFLMPGMKNSLFLQAASGHAGLNGQFANLGGHGRRGLSRGENGENDMPGITGRRIVDSLQWQHGRLGGQALVSYQTGKLDGGPNNGRSTKDFSLGGRMAYDFTNNFKLLVEAGTTSRRVEGQATQRLNKFTIAPALALAPGFWSRPEVRLYATRVTWNDAAAAANASGFAARGRKAATLFGVQLETWWD